MPWQFPPSESDSSFAAAAPQFLLHARVEFGFSEQTVAKYAECLKQVWLRWGERELTSYTRNDLLRVKQDMLERKLSVSRRTSILLALKRFLRFCRDDKKLAALDPELIVAPRRPRREVVFLTAEEVQQFLAAIKLRNGDGTLCLSGVRQRAIAELLLGSGMRIGELLSLNRSAIDYKMREAKIIGKGNKERTVFFTERSLVWLKKYLEARNDEHPALFVCQNGRDRLKRGDLHRYFVRYAVAAGLKKRVTPHILRHTAATHLLFNGCPIAHIKEILGHERLETTCRYYLGLDHRAAKNAHQKFLQYDG
jgi:site-specific recombinase XerD